MMLSGLRNIPLTFTLKRDFNMTGFQLQAKPDESFTVKRVGGKVFKRTNTTSNINLSHNLELQEEDVVRMINAGRVVFIYYQLEKRLDVYNCKDEMELLELVVNH